MPIDARPTVSRSQHECPVVPPYRLDLTVSVLRRFSTNVVDVLTPDGQYRRVLAGLSHPATVHVTQVSPEMLTVTIEGDEREYSGALALVRRMLGVDCDLTHFDRAAARMPWLTHLAVACRPR
jgi:DNA-3-methyladenine glycosylase II